MPWLWSMSSQELSPVFPLRDESVTRSPESPSPDDANVFRDITAYVEVRSQSENRSRAIAQELRELGVTVSDRLAPNVTHIVYRQGCRRTAQWAERHSVPLVSVRWIQACKASSKLLPTSNFPAETSLDVASPAGLVARRRMRSMQPKPFEEDLRLSSERKRRAARRNQRRNELRLRAAEAEQRLMSCENDGENGARSDNYFADPCIYVAKTPPSMKEFVERRGRRYSIASTDSVSPTGPQPKVLSLDSAAQSSSKTPSQKYSERSTQQQLITPLSSRSPRRQLNLGRSEASMTDTTQSSLSPSMSSLFPARKLFDASSFESGVLIEPRNSSNRLQTMCDLFPKAFQRRKILGGTEGNALRKRNRHSEQPLTKASFLFDDSEEESEGDAKIDQEALQIQVTEPSSPVPTVSIQQPVACADVTPRRRARSASHSSAASTVSEADICALVRDCSRRDRRLRVSATFSRAESASDAEASSSNKRKSLAASMTEPSSAKKNKASRASKGDTTLDSVKEVSFSTNNSTVDSSLEPSSSKKNDNTATALKDSSLSKNDSVMDCSSKNDNSVVVPSRRLSSPQKNNSSRVSFSGPSSCIKNNGATNSLNESSSSKNSTMTSLSDRMLEMMKKPSSVRRRSARSFAPAVSSSSSSSTSRRISARLQAAAAHMMEEEKEPPKAARRSSARLSETPSTSPTPPPPPQQPQKEKGEERKWSQDIFESDPGLEKVYGVLEPPCNPSRRSKRVSAASVLEKLICHDSPCSTASSTSATWRARPSLDDFRLVSDPSSPRRKRQVARQNMKTLLRPKRNIVLTSLHKKQQSSAAGAVRVLGGATLKEKVDNSTTHVVTCWPLRRTLNLLRARLMGLPILVLDWLLQSREAGHWLPEKKFLIKELCNLENSLTDQKIFAKCGSIFVSNEVVPPQRELLDIITLAGGEESITKTPENARIIIKSSKDSSPSVDPKWVLDSIMASKALPLEDYLSQE